MKNLILFTAIFASALFLSTACSTCYECDEEVVLTDNNGNPIDTTINTDEFCTSDKDDVTSRENDGAICRTQ